MTRFASVPWTGHDTRWLRYWAAKGLSFREIGERMGRHGSVIRARAERHGVEVKRVCVKTYWTSAEDAVLRERYANTGTPELAAELGRTVSQVFNRANALGLRKDPAFMSEVHGARLKKNPGPQFRKGQSSWNKGRPLAEWMPAESRKRTARTQFKKGEMHGAAQHNWVPVGTEKVRDGLLVRKVTDDLDVYPAARWVPVSRLVWEAANGPIPTGHMVRFREGMHTTARELITLDRLELLTKAENMRRNTRHRFPKELNDLLALKAALTRKINDRTKRREAKQA